MPLLRAITPWRSAEDAETLPADAEASTSGYDGDTVGTCTDGTDRLDPIPSNEIARAIAEREAVATEDLPPLFDSVDTDGLNAFLQSAPEATITFPYRGYEVTVTGSGEVHLTPGGDG